MRAAAWKFVRSAYYFWIANHVGRGFPEDGCDALEIIASKRHVKKAAMESRSQGGVEYGIKSFVACSIAMVNIDPAICTRLGVSKLWWVKGCMAVAYGMLAGAKERGFNVEKPRQTLFSCFVDKLITRLLAIVGDETTSLSGLSYRPPSNRNRILTC